MLKIHQFTDDSNETDSARKLAKIAFSIEDVDQIKFEIFLSF